MKALSIEFDPVYDITIEKGLYQRPAYLASQCQSLAKRWVIVVDEGIKQYYGEPVFQALQGYLDELYLLTLPSGEHNKTRATKQALEDDLLRLGCGKDTGLIALGGGVTTDIVGFTAATFCRGIPVIYMPTTLLSMVDASIGGKTGVNTSYGKNLIGQFYQPSAVWIDPQVLGTLPKFLWTEGMAEIIKHALLESHPLWSLLLDESEAIKQHKPATIEQLIQASLTVKKKLIEQDERETRGPRRLLNLGHTVAHALERVSHYHMRHGHAVALGLLAEAHIATIQGIASTHLPTRIQHMLHTYQLPTQLSSEYRCQSLIKAMRYDKKNQQGAIHCCLLQDIGKPYVQNGYSQAIAPDIVYQALLRLKNTNSF